MNNFAFGTYRISDLNPQHIASLKYAISSGITMIDTSSNYLDGGAERAIALAMNDFSDDIRESIEIVSKCGYIQNSNLELHKKSPFLEVVEYSDDCYHSISKSFISYQLTESLKRLKMSKIGCYLLHNPEYYILDAIKKGIDRDEMLDEMYRRIYEAFVALEEEVIAGRIASYGISSNSFSLPRDAIEFLPYEDLITLAIDAAESLGNKKHHFTTIELPINLLERDGLNCAKWAKDNSLRVLASRPLNAMHNGAMFRLAEYNESRDYYTYLNELMNLSSNSKVLTPLYNLLEELDESKHKFGWVGDYDSFLFMQILPHIQRVLEKLDDENRESILNFIDIFFQEYRKMVAYECSKTTKKLLKELIKDSTKSLQEIAIEFLLKESNVDVILVGMRKATYVDEIVAIKA